MQEHSDNDVIKEVLSTVEKFLAGTIEAKEMYVFLNVVSEARLRTNYPNRNTKGIETNN